MTTHTKHIFGTIETGGTKTKCGLGLYDQKKKTMPKILDQVQFPTTTPDETMGRIIDYFSRKQTALENSPTAKKYQASEMSAIGVACFGPLNPNPESRTFGYITTTPKPHWENYNFVGALKQKFRIPIGWDTDVNAPALAESLWGCAQGVDPVLYITVGTGLGGGAVVNGRPVHGLLHPEMGHILVRNHQHDGFKGCCPYHDYCLEGMASGTSLKQRWGHTVTEFEPGHVAWEIEAYYLAQGLQSYIMTLSPKKIMLGGGVMQQEQLFPLVREQLKDLLNGYLQVPEFELAESMEDYICPPELGDDAGLYGGLALAAQAYNS
ncbi:ROK family protein [Candidatus Haliotispira prima]|uniref:fructokinase n=1 Tax=Candidatus Haliotispira prima TaxID=3034016 RepID=A0ABY8MII9_9SPIO|nr:ROK family protein [Candidatus Haliotispira prima]